MPTGTVAAGPNRGDGLPACRARGPGAGACVMPRGHSPVMTLPLAEDGNPACGRDVRPRPGRPRKDLESRGNSLKTAAPRPTSGPPDPAAPQDMRGEAGFVIPRA